MLPRAEQAIEQHVAALHVIGRLANAAVFEEQMAFHSQFARRRRGLARVIGLERAAGEHGVLTLRQRFAQQKLQLAHLVAAAAQAGAVVALDP